MSFITITPEAMQSIKAFLEEKGVTAPLRVELHSTGCCDPSLALCLSSIYEDDLVCRWGDLQFVIGPELHNLVGEVRIDWANDENRRGYVVTSTRPLSEWTGFGISDIRIPDEVKEPV